MSEKFLSFHEVSRRTIISVLYYFIELGMIHSVVFLSLCSCIIQYVNIKQKTLCVCYFFIKRKKLFGQPNISKCVAYYFLFLFLTDFPSSSSSSSFLLFSSYFVKSCGMMRFLFFFTKSSWEIARRQFYSVFQTESNFQ